jgi:hypothetical protein
MKRQWLREGVLAATLVSTLAVAAAAQEKPTLHDQFIEQLATQLARVAEAGSPRMAAYFTAEPTPQVRAYLEGQGVEIIVAASGTATPAVPAGTPPPLGPIPPTPGFTTIPVPTAGPYGMVGMRVPESKKLIQGFLAGVRELVASLPPDSPLVIEVFTVDLPGGSITFRAR